MWKKYFPSGNIYSIDIYDKSALQEERIKIFREARQIKPFWIRFVMKQGHWILLSMMAAI